MRRKVPVSARTEAPVEVRVWRLRVSDRCDRCGAQAFVAAQVPHAPAELLFCGHHFRKHEVRLRTIGAKITDERERINPRPSTSANAG